MFNSLLFSIIITFFPSISTMCSPIDFITCILKDNSNFGFLNTTIVEEKFAIRFDIVQFSLLSLQEREGSAASWRNFDRSSTCAGGFYRARVARRSAYSMAIFNLLGFSSIDYISGDVACVGPENMATLRNNASLLCMCLQKYIVMHCS